MQPNFCFVHFQQHADIVNSKIDLQKPPVRMWLFGMITIIEMALTRMIEAVYPDGSDLKELEALRNNLAHSWDIIACDWDIIVKLTGYMEQRLGTGA